MAVTRLITHHISKGETVTSLDKGIQPIVKCDE